MAPASRTLVSNTRHGRCDVLIVVGTRPEAVKMLPVILELADSELFEPVVLSTGQHEAMVEEILQLAGIRVDAILAPPVGSGGLNALLPAVMRGFSDYCEERYGFDLPAGPAAGQAGRRPCGVLVQGDTTSALAAALAAFHLRIPVIHVEAGLRTGGSVVEPFPEELNRQAISRIACLHLAPTATSAENLIREQVPMGRILVTGNTAIDAFRFALGLDVAFTDPRLERIDGGNRRMVLVTAHRRESWGGGLGRIAEAVARLAARYPEVDFVVSVHPNPIVQRELGEPLDGFANTCVTEPLGYGAFARLIARSCLAITDSGGIQEEAPAVDTPVLVTRETTERVEALAAGTVRLVGTDPGRIEQAASSLLDDPSAHALMADAPNPYGDGRAAARIVNALAHMRGHADAPAPFGPGYERARVIEVTGVAAAGDGSSPGQAGPELVPAFAGSRDRP